MFTQISNAHTEVVTSLVFSPHVVTTGEGGLLCSTSGDDTTALWDLRAGPGASQRAAHLTGHHVGPVNHALFHPSNAYTLLTASDDRSIGCWDLRRPDRVVGTVSGFQEGVNKMLWLPVTSDGCRGTGGSSSGGGWRVVSACDDGHVYIHALSLSNSGSESVTVADTAPVPQVGALVDKFRVSTSTVNDIVLAPNSISILITASEDCALRSWSLRHAQQMTNTSVGLMEDRLLATLDEFENPVNHVVVVPSGLMAPVESRAAGEGPESGSSRSLDGAAGDAEECADAASASTGFPRAYQQVHGGNVVEDAEAGSDTGSSAGARQPRRATDISEAAGTGCWLLAACSECVFGVDFALRIGEFGTGARAFVGHQDYVRGLEFTSEGKLLTVSDDSTAIEWDLATTDPIRQVKLHDGLVMSSAVSPSRDLLATGTDRGELRVWRLPFATERIGGSP
ncbi:hypothetical protein, conserved [Leishmania donovani]|uniref:WD domain, G-beta repeat family protein n=1 Tax=Leishmania donovani TaxID=5661 RepID=E9BFX3_LEIDO|nr:hypothetical protein, conserved [Leishmania donovani]TPP46958.1 WD domain, G-beta repeat family protein [Leishmania donovani]CBZ34149.1 hypothetical protein, conserved [Leishmania donovani]